jgi:hypothetical protein
MNTITMIGIAVLFFYCFTQVLKFYGVGEEVYGVYICFYIMLLLSMCILPRDYPSF